MVKIPSPGPISVIFSRFLLSNKLNTQDVASRLINEDQWSNRGKCFNPQAPWMFSPSTRQCPGLSSLASALPCPEATAKSRQWNTFSINRIGLDGRCLLTIPTEIDTDVELVVTSALVINGHPAFVFLTRIQRNGISSDVLEDAFAIANIVWIKFHLHTIDRRGCLCRRDDLVHRGDGRGRKKLTTGILGR